MKIARLAGLMLAAVMALGLVVASAAFAEPEFHPTGGTFTGTQLGVSTLAAAEETIECTANTTSGTVSSATLAGGVTVDFTGCKSTGTGGKECTAKSVGAAEGLIITKTLHGVLGLILPSKEAGLLLLPVENKKFVTIASNKCTVETTISGNVAGLIGTVGTGLVLNNTLIFQKGTTGESIKDFDLSTGGLVKPELEAFGKEASQSTTEDIMFTPVVEVS